MLLMRSQRCRPSNGRTAWPRLGDGDRTADRDQLGQADVDRAAGGRVPAALARRIAGLPLGRDLL